MGSRSLFGGYHPGVVPLILALLNQEGYQIILRDSLLAYDLPTLERRDGCVDMRLDFGFRPFLDVIVICGLSTLLKLHKGVSHDLLQMTRNDGVRWSKLLTCGLVRCVLQM